LKTLFKEMREVSEVEVRIEDNTVTPFEISGKEPLFHYSFKKETLFWPFKKV
jgi:hypothetical protein